MARDFARRIELHGWASSAYAGLYAGIVVGDTLSMIGRLAAIGMGVIGVFATLRAFHNLGPTPILRENILAFWDRMNAARLGANAALVTVGLTAAPLLAAMRIADPSSVLRQGTADALRTAAYLVLFAYLWRLAPRWRACAVAAWVLLDLLAAAAAGAGFQAVQGHGVTAILVGAPVTWALLVAQDALDPERSATRPDKQA